MSEPTGREIARRETAPPGVERFSAPETAHTAGLTDERAAEIVRQSSNARTLGLAALLFTLIFVPLYWFYDLGFPGVAGSSRLAAEAEDVTPGTADGLRVVTLEANAQLRFVPESVEVKKGETIRFEITNTAGFPHNFWIGPQAGVEKQDTAALKGTIDFSAGTRSVDVTFDGEGPYSFGCFIPGHYEAGMEGSVTLLP